MDMKKPSIASIRNRIRDKEETGYLWLAVFLLILLDNGGFRSHTTCFVLLISLIYICFSIKRREILYLEKKQSIFWVGMILFGGILSVFVGIDRGESIYGLIRLVSFLAMRTAVQQIEDSKRYFLLKMIPLLGLLLMTGCLFHDFSLFDGWVSVAGRLNGSFQYSNTMALFLLIGIISAEHLWGKGKKTVQLILAAGILGTGSRTAFVLLCGYLIYAFFRYKGKNRYVLLIFLSITGLIWIITVLGGNLYGISRFLRLSFHASTFQGRLLYWEDAISILSKHPFGTGYMGYFYLQQAEQTGVYSVRFVHNEWIQWILDYGILAGIGLVMYLIGQCEPKRMPILNRELLILIGVYSFFDFHLQFFAIVFIIALLIPGGNDIQRYGRGEKRMFEKMRLQAGLGISLVLCVSNVLGEYYANFENYGMAVKWNPISAQYKQEYLLQSQSLESAAAYADKLLEENRYLYAAYLIKSNAAAQNGQIDAFIENRKRVLRLRKYKVEEYEDYFEILFRWYAKAYQEKNIGEMRICLEAMKEIQELMTEAKKSISLRAYRIQEKPNLFLKKEYAELLERLEEGTNG